LFLDDLPAPRSEVKPRTDHRRVFAFALRDADGGDHVDDGGRELISELLNIGIRYVVDVRLEVRFDVGECWIIRVRCTALLPCLICAHAFHLEGVDSLGGLVESLAIRLELPRPSLLHRTSDATVALKLAARFIADHDAGSILARKYRASPTF
jgi:hypothetical protein